MLGDAEEWPGLSAVFGRGCWRCRDCGPGAQRSCGAFDRAPFPQMSGSTHLGCWLPFFWREELDDVNTVTFADDTGHIIYSGGDDSICKIWDMRCSTSEGRAAGALSGHIEGITYIDTRGDGRYFISNGKDQTVKLWDVRRMSSRPDYFKRRGPRWDYRYMPYPLKAKNLKHPRDQSVATYRGHSVLGSLIRCHFSPSCSTGQKYIYTGSYDGCVYIYEVVTGVQVAKLDLGGSIVRDCSWHPNYPMLVSSSWDCIVARWEFSGKDANLSFA